MTTVMVLPHDDKGTAHGQKRQEEEAGYSQGAAERVQGQVVAETARLSGTQVGGRDGHDRRIRKGNRCVQPNRARHHALPCGTRPARRVRKLFDDGDAGYRYRRIDERRLQPVDGDIRRGKLTVRGINSLLGWLYGHDAANDDGNGVEARSNRVKLNGWLILNSGRGLARLDFGDKLEACWAYLWQDAVEVTYSKEAAEAQKAYREELLSMFRSNVAQSENMPDNLVGVTPPSWWYDDMVTDAEMGSG